MTFKEKYLAGEIEFEAIDEYIDIWNNSDDDRTLAKFLGLNAEEEDVWIDDSDEALQELLDMQTAFTDDGWYVTYKVPFAFIRRFFPDFNPTKGTKIRANFYKCGDETKKMHFLAWNPITVEEPAFHVPSDFGCLIFGE